MGLAWLQMSSWSMRRTSAWDADFRSFGPPPFSQPSGRPLLSASSSPAVSGESLSVSLRNSSYMSKTLQHCSRYTCTSNSQSNAEKKPCIGYFRTSLQPANCSMPKTEAITLSEGCPKRLGQGGIVLKIVHLNVAPILNQTSRPDASHVTYS